MRARASAFYIISPGSETPSFKVPSHLSGLKTKCDLAWSLAGSAESVLSQSPVHTDGARFPSSLPVLVSASASFVFWTPGFSIAGILSAFRELELPLPTLSFVYSYLRANTIS